MGVISNKVNIMDLMQSGGGDPTIPGRVSALETETAGLIEANAKIMTSVSSMKADLDKLSYTERTITATPDGTKTGNELLVELHTNLTALYDTLETGQMLEIVQLKLDYLNGVVPSLPNKYTKGTDTIGSVSMYQIVATNQFIIRCVTAATSTGYTHGTQALISPQGAVTVTEPGTSVIAVNKECFVKVKIYG